MGIFSWMPFLECSHGVLSFDHTLSGSFEVSSQTEKPEKTRRIDFNNGKGYTEKDWGVTFPSSYIWLQSNHFDSDKTISVFASVANVPAPYNLPFSFKGYIAALQLGSDLYRFTTYLGSR